jgi:hypothetical protein
MNSFIKTLKSMFTVFGLFMAGLVVYVAVEDAMQAGTPSVIKNLVADDTDTVKLQEFVSIQPRVVWPVELGPSDVLSADIERNFIASFEARGTRLTAEQKQVVRFVIVPRLKELTARSVDKAKAQGLTEDEDIARVMIDDVCVFSPRYAKAMATILRMDSTEKGRIDAITGDVAINVANTVEDR